MNRRVYREVGKTLSLLARVFLGCIIGLVILVVAIGFFLGWRSADIIVVVIGLGFFGFIIGGIALATIEYVLLGRARRKTRLQEGEFIIKEFDGGRETLQGFSRGKWFITNRRLTYEGRVKRTSRINDISFRLDRVETLEVEYRPPYDDFIGGRVAHWIAQKLGDKTMIVCILATVRKNDEEILIPIYIDWPEIYLIDFLRTVQESCSRVGNPIIVEFPK